MTHAVCHFCRRTTPYGIIPEEDCKTPNCPLLIKQPQYRSAWESDLGKRIVETHLRRNGITDARVISIKDLSVTLESTASQKEIADAEVLLKRATTKGFWLTVQHD